jgi:hypothetical protein
VQFLGSTLPAKKIDANAVHGCEKKFIRQCFFGVAIPDFSLLTGAQYADLIESTKRKLQTEARLKFIIFFVTAKSR